MVRRIFAILSVALLLQIPAPGNCKGLKTIFPSRKTNADPGTPKTLDLHANMGATCYTKEGLKGKCLPIRNCPELLEMINARGTIHSSGTNSNGADYLLRQRVCGYAFREAHLCCLNVNEPVQNPVLPSLDECGIPSAHKITKGENYTHGAHPWLVGVGHLQDKSSIQVECGGTLITKRHVLTAAHCFYRAPRDRTPQLTHVILGEHSLSRETEKTPPIILPIAARKNPGYNYYFRYRDIELLVLQEDVSFSYYIKPACLPFNDQVKHFNLEEVKMAIAGWGRIDFYDLRGTDTPLQASVSVIPLSKCREAYKYSSMTKIDNTQICLGGDGKDSCRGDSGGPALYEDNKMFHRYFLIGITAYGTDKCGNEIFPGVYTYVPAYMDWIVNNL